MHLAASVGSTFFRTVERIFEAETLAEMCTQRSHRRYLALVATIISAVVTPAGSYSAGFFDASVR